MINDALSSRLNAYIPEVLLITEGDIRQSIITFIHTSAVSLDFEYIRSADTANEVISKSLSLKIIDNCANFIQNIVRFGKLADPDNTVINSYFPESIVTTILTDNRFKCLLALAYLNAGHGSLIAAPVIDIKGTRNGNPDPGTGS